MGEINSVFVGCASRSPHPAREPTRSIPVYGQAGPRNEAGGARPLPRSSHLVGTMPFQMLFPALFLLASCSSPVELAVPDDEGRVLGAIEHYGDPVQVEMPLRVSAGEPFTVTVTTYGGAACPRARWRYPCRHDRPPSVPTTTTLEQTAG